MYFLANEHETPVQSIEEKEFTNLQECRNSFRCTEKRKSQKTPAHAQQNSAFPERQLLFTVWPPKKAGSKPVRSQARPRGSEAHRLRKKTKQLNNCEKYNDTIGWHCYEAALLSKKKTRYKLDEEAPLFFERTTGYRKFFFRKREKAKAFSLSIKRNLSLS